MRAGSVTAVLGTTGLLQENVNVSVVGTTACQKVTEVQILRRLGWQERTGRPAFAAEGHCKGSRQLGRQPHHEVGKRPLWGGWTAKAAVCLMRCTLRCDWLACRC